MTGEEWTKLQSVLVDKVFDFVLNQESFDVPKYITAFTKTLELEPGLYFITWVAKLTAKEDLTEPWITVTSSNTYYANFGTRFCIVQSIQAGLNVTASAVMPLQLNANRQVSIAAACRLGAEKLTMSNIVCQAIRIV